MTLFPDYSRDDALVTQLKAVVELLQSSIPYKQQLEKLHQTVVDGTERRLVQSEERFKTACDKERRLYDLACRRSDNVYRARLLEAMDQRREADAAALETLEAALVQANIPHNRVVEDIERSRGDSERRLLAAADQVRALTDLVDANDTLVVRLIGRSFPEAVSISYIGAATAADWFARIAFMRGGRRVTLVNANIPPVLLRYLCFVERINIVDCIFTDADILHLDQKQSHALDLAPARPRVSFENCPHIGEGIACLKNVDVVSVVNCPGVTEDIRRMLTHLEDDGDGTDDEMPPLIDLDCSVTVDDADINVDDWDSIDDVIYGKENA